jgi:hypothetical protein
MKLIERTSQRLTLKSRPWIAWLGGSLCAGLGLMLLAIPKPTTQLACARTQGTCQLSSSGLSHSQNRIIGIADLQKAQREVPKQMIRQINDFIQNPQIGTLSIEQKSHPGIYLLGALGTILGGLMIVAAGTTRVSFDRPSGLVKIVRGSLLRDRSYSCQLHSIAEVRLERSMGRPSSPQASEKGDYCVYRISLALTDGSQLPLTANFAPDLHQGEDIAALVRQIQQFLQGIPLLRAADGVRMDEIKSIRIS